MPNTPLEMAAIEKFMHSSYSVPWEIRTKGGCVTHLRSIAEKSLVYQFPGDMVEERLKKALSPRVWIFG
ncbi:unnamed protein product [Lupinus luteus]|uniref:Uncharacterized protein n=1 Tax=Lupinus luteus TaxID=3873 RepID=A0AAV1WK41_LUPLU